MAILTRSCKKASNNKSSGCRHDKAPDAEAEEEIAKEAMQIDLTCPELRQERFAICKLTKLPQLRCLQMSAW
ncbi:hypothetical protein SP19_175 [Salmonella phage 19]|nr:hypothetical protein SP19_175 [Salmonella phage 19]